MTVHEYQPGRWTALVTHDALALLHPAVSTDVARELWQLTATGKRLGGWVEYLAAAGIAALPSFAMVEAHPDGMRVLVRGEVDVELGGRVVSGRGYTTWREEVLPAAAATVRADAGEEGWLPVAGGIVRAGSARLVLGPDVVAAAVEEDDDVELTVARMPALAAAVGVPPSSGAPGPAPGSSDGATPGAVTADPLGVDPDPPDAGADPADAPAVEDRPADGVPDASTGTPEEDDPEDADDYDFLLWSTEQLRSHESTRQPAAPPSEEDGEPSVETAASPAEAVADPAPLDLEATRDPEPDEEPYRGPDVETAAAFAPGGIIDSVPGLSRPARATPPPVGPPVELPPPAGGPVTVGPDDDGDHDGQTIATSALPRTDLPAAPAEPELRRAAPDVELVLSTGPRIEMDRPVLLGRAPEAARFAGSELPRLVSVSNPERDISATHVEVRPAGGHVVVTDMNSTNGTILHLPDQPPVRLQPGTGVPVGAGAVIELGAGVTVTVTQVGETP